MKKSVLFIISALILVFSLTSCDTSDIANDNHNFTVKYNDEVHYNECDCGHIEHEEEHIFSDAIHLIQKESCSQEGIYEYHCIVCKYTKEVRKDKLPHEFGEWETTVEATCLNQGQQKRVCKNCGYEEFRDTNKAPHTPVAYDTVDADCTHEGHTGGTFCSVCKEELSVQTTIDKTTHTYGEWTIVDNPTCTSIGSAERKCEVCGHTEHKTLDKLSHTVTPYDEDPSTCIHKGHTGGSYCSECGTVLEERTELELASHKYGDWIVTDEPSCTQIGHAKRECSICGNTEYKDLDMLPHTATSYTDLEANCQHEGHIGGTYCSVCNKELTPYTIVDKTGHDFTEWTVSIEATCISKGQEKRVCNVCGKEEYRDVEKTSHISTPYTDLEATCQHEGHIGGTYCSFCNQELTPYTVVDKKTHNYGDYVTTQTPTCISVGQEKRTCNDCGHEDFRELAMTSHIPTPGEAKASTCIEHGYTEGSYCSFCHKELEAPEELPFGDHNYSVETTTKEATINSDGILTHTCSVCGDSYTTSIPRKALTQMIWINSFKDDDFKNHFVEYYYCDHTLNKTYDITIINKDNIKYVKIIDNDTTKVYEYYYDGHVIIESCVGGYRHRAYVDMPDTDMYLEWYGLVLYNAVYFASFAYDKVEFKTDNGGYFIANGIEVKNCKGNTETASVAVSFSDDEKLTGFSYSSDKYDIAIFEIGTAPSITIPNETHHHIVDGKCDVCNEEYNTYTQTINNMKLNYYVHKNNKSLEFDYSLVYSNQTDVSFLMPTYSEKDGVKKVIAQYYEGTSPYTSKEVKSFTINSNKLLKITYSDNTIERLLLLNDNTAVVASSDSSYASNSYNGNVIGQTFEYVTNDYTYKYYIRSNDEIEITRYKEIAYYNIDGTAITGFNRNLEKVLGFIQGYGSGNDTKHDGSKGTVYFQLNEDLSLEIYYEGIASSMKAFDHITFQNIAGYYINGKKDFYIYFRGDNVDYVIHYNNSNIITISKI